MDSALLARSLEKGLDGRNVSAELNPGVSPVYSLLQESEHPEMRYLRQERWAAHTNIDAADAANVSMVGVLNPANSGTLIVVTELIHINRTAAAIVQEIRIGLTAGITFDGTVAGLLRDMRYGPPATARATGLVFLETAAAAIGNITTRVSIPPGDTVVTPGPFILPPGTFVAICGNVVNQETVGSMRWIERAAESGEVQGSGV